MCVHVRDFSLPSTSDNPRAEGIVIMVFFNRLCSLTYSTKNSQLSHTNCLLLKSITYMDKGNIDSIELVKKKNVKRRASVCYSL